MLLTFGELKSSRIQQIASACSSSDEFASLVNAATRQLMKRGNWWSTIQPMQGCVYGNCITWNRHVETVVAMNRFDSPSQISNHWYEFMPIDESHRRDACHYDKNGWAGNLMTTFNGTSPVFNQIPCGRPMYLRFYIDRLSDVRKTITIYGTDSNGQTLRTVNADGTMQDGMILAFAVPYVQSPVALQSVDRVLKVITDGNVRGYQFDFANNMLFDLATYEPTETSPNYIVSKIVGRNGTSCSGLTKITALVKLAFIPVVADSDVVMIEDEDAIRDMVMSIKAKEAGEIADSQALELTAFRELNYQSRNKWGIEQFQSNFRPFGSASLKRKTGNFI